LLEPRSFDVCKNTAAPIIAMLGHLEVDTEVLNVGIEIMEFNGCREMLGGNRVANGILAMM